MGGIDLTGITNLPMDIGTVNLTDTDISLITDHMDTKFLMDIISLPTVMDTINLTDTDINPFMEAMDIIMEATDTIMVDTDITINLGTTNVSMTPMEDTIPVTREVTSPTENPMDLMEMIIHMAKKITTVLMITMITTMTMITNTRRTTTIMTG